MKRRIHHGVEEEFTRSFTEKRRDEEEKKGALSSFFPFNSSLIF